MLLHKYRGVNGLRLAVVGVLVASLLFYTPYDSWATSAVIAEFETFMLKTGGLLNKSITVVFVLDNFSATFQARNRRVNLVRHIFWGHPRDLSLHVGDNC